MRIPLAILLAMTVTAARAGAPGPCPSFHAGWALSGSGPITGILWDQFTQQMYVLWTNTPVTETLYCPIEDEDKITLLVTEGTPISLRSENPACTASLRKNVVSDYYPVPDSSVMQTFSQTPQANWVQTFNYLIAPRYEAILLQDVNNCPILQDSSAGPGGFIWVD